MACAVLASAAVLMSAAPAGAAPTALGDQRVSRSSATAGGALACSVRGKPARPTEPWIRGGRVDASRRPVVAGTEAFDDARFTLRRRGASYAFTGNGLPVTGPAGRFPPAAESPAARWSGGTVAPAEYRLTGSFPAAPRRLRRAACVSARVPVAVARNGVPILAAFGGDGADLVARLPTDACGGRTDAAGRYAYRAAPLCLDVGPQRGHSRLIGYARDGYGLYGQRGTGGRRLRASDLDACHGHTHRVALRGRTRRAYHYHATSDFPHTVGCFRGRPASGWKRGAPAAVPTPAAPAAAAAAPAPAPAAPAVPDRLALTTSPGLQPAFDRAVTDYVARCSGTTPVRVDVTAAGTIRVAVDGAAAREGTFSASVPLTAGQRFAITVSGGGGTTTHHVRCLPSDFPGYTATATGTAQAEWYFVTPFETLPVYGYAAIFDRRGVPVWWSRMPAVGPFDFKLLPNGRIGWFAAPGDFQPLRFEERALDGALMRATSAVGHGADFHDFEELPGGRRRFVVYRERDGVDVTAYNTGGPPEDSSAGVIDAEVQEVDADGNLVWSWNSATHIGLEETGRWWQRDSDLLMHDPERYDIAHINSVEEDGDGIIVSLRHTDAIYRIDKATGDVDWKLGGTTTPESLTVLGDDPAITDPTKHLGGQHDARRLPDGTVTLFDNGTGLGRAPRALRFEIDTTARTATIVEKVTDPDPAIASSFCCGSARRLPGGNWVISWGGANTATELTPTGARPFGLDFADAYFTYRVAPVLPGALSASAVRAGMDAQHPR